MIAPDLARQLRASVVAIQTSGARGSSGGSGVIWSSDGAIVTNAHVLRARDPLVILPDGRKFSAAVIGHDRRRDLALLRIPVTGLPAATLGDSRRLRPGQLVLAVGNPLGISGAVTCGTIHSTPGRHWIEAGVRLAPGNSGGMLADAEGRLIGITAMIQSGLALAIPSEAVVSFVRAAERLSGARAA